MTTNRAAATISAAPVGTPPPTDPTVYDEHWYPIGTLAEPVTWDDFHAMPMWPYPSLDPIRPPAALDASFNQGGLVAGPIEVVNRTGEPIPIMPMSEVASLAHYLGPRIPKSSLIDIGPDGIGRCRLCPYTYRATAPAPWTVRQPSSWELPDDPMPSTAPRNRADRRRTR